MWVAVKLLTIPLALFAAAAIGAIGSWGLPLGSVLLLAACVAGAVSMESHDLAAVEALSPAMPEEEPLLEAA